MSDVPARDSSPSLPGGALAIVVATCNRKKFAELERVLAAANAGVELLSLELFADADESPETGATFAENARQKAFWYASATGQLCLADDSGLEVDALDGAPGVRSARYAGEHASDADNRRKLLDALRDVSRERRTARFRCALALAAPPDDRALDLERPLEQRLEPRLPNVAPREVAPADAAHGDLVFACDGTSEGTILDAERGRGGFGYDPLFFSSELGKTFAEAAPAEKDRVSHRGRALARLLEFLRATTTP